MKKIKNDVKDWIKIKSILENGIVNFKNNKYIKIIKINPINYNLKSELEKDAILKAYKTFLKTCDFDIQILIQSKKEDLSKNIFYIEKNLKNREEKFLKSIASDYKSFIQTENINNKSSSKNFYIIIESTLDKVKTEDLILDDLNEKHIKVKECLSRCGNYVYSYLEKEEVFQIIRSFFIPNNN